MAEYLILFNEEWVPDLTEEDLREASQRVTALRAEMTAAGVLIFTGGLDDGAPVFSVDVSSGPPLVTDGPFAETKEQLGRLRRHRCDRRGGRAVVGGKDRGGVRLASGGATVQVRDCPLGRSVASSDAPALAWLSPQVEKPVMSRVDALQSVCQPTALTLIQRRQDRCEVGVVFRPIVLRLEQEHDFGNHEGDPVLVGLDDLGVGTADRSFATTDPHVAVVRISEDVEVVRPRRSIADPGLVHHIEGCLIFEWPDVARADDIEVELRKGATDLGEPTQTGTAISVSSWTRVATPR